MKKNNNNKVLQFISMMALSVMLFAALFVFTIPGYAQTINMPSSASEKTDQIDNASLPVPRSKPTIPAAVQVDGEQHYQEKEVFFTRLNDIIRNIKQQRQTIEEKKLLLAKSASEEEKNDIQAEIDAINQTIKEQEKSFEMIQTGGLDLTKLEASQEKVFDWQKDLLEILQPIMNELRQLTEDKRKLVNLRNKIAYHQSQIDDIRKALQQMARINKEGLEPDALERFEQIHKKWQDLLDENTHLHGVAQLQLEGMIASQSEREISIVDHFVQFATGRGATILLAVIAALGVYFTLSLIWKGIVWSVTQGKHSKWSYYHRLITLIYSTIKILLAITAAFYVLSLRGDQTLIGIAFLILIFLVLVLKNALPGYLKELQIVLNAGSVREGELIVYNNIPMKIERLNFYTQLSNPFLPDLKLRVPLAELSNYISRPYSDSEPWFPCQVGDYVILSDDRYGWVKCVSLDYVQLSLSDGSMPQTYAMSDFLSLSPKNLSQGFLITSVIGIDYQYQPECTSTIPQIFQEGIRQRVLQESYGSALKSISVYFEQANASSLDYKIIVTFEGRAAGDYFSIRRDLQRFAVDVCNQEQWNIPFTQLVVHHVNNGSAEPAG